MKDGALRLIVDYDQEFHHADRVCNEGSFTYTSGGEEYDLEELRAKGAKSLFVRVSQLDDESIYHSGAIEYTEITFVPCWNLYIINTDEKVIKNLLPFDHVKNTRE